MPFIGGMQRWPFVLAYDFLVSVQLGKSKLCEQFLYYGRKHWIVWGPNYCPGSASDWICDFG